jgi:hypothetical protein
VIVNPAGLSTLGADELWANRLHVFKRPLSRNAGGVGFSLSGLRCNKSLLGFVAICRYVGFTVGPDGNAVMSTLLKPESVWEKGIRSSATVVETSWRERLLEMFHHCPIPDDELLSNLGLFIGRQKLSRILYMQELYQKIINVHGIVIEFGVRWGQNLALFESFRGIYEPYNYNRRIVGFDTFAGFPAVDAKDGTNEVIEAGAFTVTPDYEHYLQTLMDYHEHESPISHLKKYELVKGDAGEEIDRYLDRNPQTIVAFAYFDLDLYEPTRRCLQAISGRLTKGTVLGFDELNYPDCPGETLAVQEILGLNRYAIRRSPLSPHSSWMVIE